MKRKLWIWVSMVLILFASVVLLVLIQSERSYKKSLLSTRLEAYADVVSKSDDLAATCALLPDSIRVTVLHKDGIVIFDSEESADSLDNHLDRPEIKDCIANGVGYAIRRSETLNVEFIYMAQLYGDEIVRTALPFELSERRFMHPDLMVITAVILALIAAMLMVLIITERFGKQGKRDTEERLQAQKRQMTNNIAHEIRTPVTSIRGYLETLVNSPELDAEHRALFTERAYQQTLRLSDLIRDIALVTKMEEAPELLEKSAISVKKLCDEVIEEMSAKIAENNVTVENMIAPNCIVKGNPILIYSIFRNLVENSLRYAGNGVTLHLESFPPETGKVRFLYYDTGRGVAPGLTGKIFERFYRVTPPGVNVTDGSGLGLSIVRNAVHFHNGEISAKNRLPHGLEVDFTISEI